MYKQAFPFFESNPNVVFLDSAASTQKPTVVLDAMDDFYRTMYANVHRGSCEIANKATTAYEYARQMVADFIHAPVGCLVFTKGTTESINLVAASYRETLGKGDEIIIFESEHHANFVPWQQMCLKTGATFHVIPVLPNGCLDMDMFQSKLSDRTRLVAVAQISNVLGQLNPVENIIRLAHGVGARVLIDGAQSAPHMPIDVTAMDCDFFVFSGHKMYGPTGIGGLYGKKEALESLRPYQYGGDMIRTVSAEETTFADIPARFEAGTPPFVEAIGLAAAVRFLMDIGMEKVVARERELTDYLMTELQTVSGVQILGDVTAKHGIVAFNITGIHADDISFALTAQNICVRVGHHCAMPIHARFNTPVSLRVSLGLYNAKSDIDAFIRALKKAVSFF